MAIDRDATGAPAADAVAALAMYRGRRRRRAARRSGLRNPSISERELQTR
jgi:uncharacterized protein (TIGR03382 family)